MHVTSNWYTYLYRLYHKNQLNVVKYTSHMDSMDRCNPNIVILERTIGCEKHSVNSESPSNLWSCWGGPLCFG